VNASVDPRAGLWRRIAPSILISAVVPVVVYTVLRPHVGSDATALLVAAAVPAVFTLAKLAWRRRWDPIGVIAVCGFAIALTVLVATGGNTLVLKLHEAVVTGPLGLVLLGSAAIGKPLHLVALRLFARRNPALARLSQAPGSRRSSTVITVLLGSMMVLHAVVLLVLALSLPTQTYLETSRPAGLVVLALGIGSLFWYRNHRQRELAAPRGDAR
jgi:hypothetical protein